MLVDVAAVMGTAHLAQRYVEGSFDVGTTNALLLVTGVPVLPAHSWLLFRALVVQHVLRSLVVLKQNRSHLVVANLVRSNHYVGMRQFQSLTSATMEPARLVGFLVEKIILVAMPAS